VSVPAAGCTIFIDQVTTAAGISTQNISGVGGNDVSATPWGLKLVAAVTGIHYDTTGSCLIANHGTGAYSGTVAVSALFGTL
jgi:hypothetical protein